MVRVLAVTPWFPSEKKPDAGVFALQDVRLLAVSHDVTVIHLADSDDRFGGEPVSRTIEPGIDVLQIPYTQLSPKPTLLVRRAIREHLKSADLVHTMAAHSLLPVALAAPPVPWVHTEHWSVLVSPVTSRRKQIARRLYTPLLSKPDVAVAVGHALASAVEQYRSGQVTIIGNWVRLASPGDGIPEAPEARGQGPLRLIAVGSLIERKGPLTTVDAVSVLSRRGIPVTLRWIGAGPLLADAKRRALELGVDDKVAFVGSVPPDEIPKNLLNAHILVSATSSETFGLAIAEALGHGLPVVATGVGEHRRLIPPEASRWVADRNGDSIADAIEALSADPRRWDAKAIMAYAAEQFSDQRRQVAYRDVYCDAIEQHRLRRHG